MVVRRNPLLHTHHAFLLIEAEGFGFKSLLMSGADARTSILLLSGRHKGDKKVQISVVLLNIVQTPNLDSCYASIKGCIKLTEQRLSSCADCAFGPM